MSPEITPTMLRQITGIARLLGMIDAQPLSKPRVELRKRNRIRTIRASLAIEGNQLSEAQVTALLENQRVAGPAKDIREVQNAIAVYAQLSDFNAYAEADYLKAHGILMNGLMEYPGRYRTQNVGIVQGQELAHLAPPGWNVPKLMGDLFGYLRESEDHMLIKSCVFHYEMEFIHPFYDGNGRMGRLWQSLLLMRYHPIFEFLPVEKAIRDTQSDYYRALSSSDKAGHSVAFVEYALAQIQKSLATLLEETKAPLRGEDRLEHFLSTLASNDIPFSRMDYLNAFPRLSPATASRDLQKGVDQQRLIREGDKRNARYRPVSDPSPSSS